MSSTVTQQRYDIEPPVEPSKGNVSVGDWVDHFGLVHELVPFEYRHIHPFDTVASFRETFASKPITAARITLGELAENADINQSAVSNAQAYVELAGSWNVPRNNQRSSYWANPHYVHGAPGEPITDPDERREALRRLAGYGIFTREDIAPRFGLESAQSLHNWLQRYDIPWLEWRQEGVRSLARTVHLAQHWTDHSQNEIADALGMSRGTLGRWLQHHARDDPDWDVPEDPSFAGWFCKSSTARKRALRRDAE